MQTFNSLLGFCFRNGEATKHMNIVILTALLLGACKTNDPLVIPHTYAEYSIIDGDTIKTKVFKDFKKLKNFDPNGRN